jgi:hypothetical protein
LLKAAFYGIAAFFVPKICHVSVGLYLRVKPFFYGCCMSEPSQETEIALLKRDVEDLTITVQKLNDSVEAQTAAITRTKGIIFGASLVVSAIWAVGVSAVAYFK